MQAVNALRIQACENAQIYLKICVYTTEEEEEEEEEELMPYYMSKPMQIKSRFNLSIIQEIRQ